MTASVSFCWSRRFEITEATYFYSCNLPPPPPLKSKSQEKQTTSNFKIFVLTALDD